MVKTRTGLGRVISNEARLTVAEIREMRSRYEENRARILYQFDSLFSNRPQIEYYRRP